MSGDAPEIGLPAIIPVFPLTGAMLLPRGPLPLNIFEPRYKAMVEDALGTPLRLIGMIQPSHPSADGEPPLFSVGCAGRITEFSETGDERYLITLTGLSRFRVDAEIEGARGYRRVRADWAPFAADLVENEGAAVDRKRFLPALKDYFKQCGISADWSAIENTGDERLITLLAMVCPFEPNEKQALLEAIDLPKRVAVMTALVEMAILEGGGADAPRH